MPKRDMTIGVTVNLQNYESLRIEVRDDVETGEDVRALAAFLDESLALFGRGDAATQKTVDHYRKRVLSGATGSEASAPAPSAPTPAPAARPAKAPAPPVEEPATPGPAATELPSEAPAPAPKPAAKAAPGKAPAKTPAPSPTGAVCEACGAPVSAAEEKTSRLFVSKVLCKKCIQTL
jgi:hypothetical protein